MTGTVVDLAAARPYVDAFDRRAHEASEPDWLVKARERGLARFAEHGFPTRRSEGWRYLDLRPLERTPLLPEKAPRDGTAAAAQLDAVAFAGPSFRLVLVDGRLAPALSRVEGAPKGVFLGTMRQAMERHELIARQALAHSDGAVQGLNTAFFSDGVAIVLEPGTALDRPIEIVHLATAGEARSLHTRSLVHAGEGSRATILESYAGAGGYWRNDVLDMTLGTGAEVTHIRLVEEAADAMHIADARAVLEGKAALTVFALLLDGRLSRQQWEIVCSGAETRTAIDGAFLLTGRQEANIVTLVDHAAPGGRTRETVKGVAADRAQGAFQGKMLVRQDAQRVDAQQTSRNLLLGERAVIDAKPELEIHADDVKCGHGATVGDLDETALFYLRSRGLADLDARRILIEAFLQEAVDLVEDEALRAHLSARLHRRLATLDLRS